jgi:hypothetical protein
MDLSQDRLILELERPCPLIFPGRVHGTHWIGGSVCLRAVVDNVKKIEICFHLPGIEFSFLGHPALSLVAIPIELSRIPLRQYISGSKLGRPT